MSIVTLLATAVTAGWASASTVGIGQVTSFKARFGTDRPGTSSSLALTVTGKPPSTGVSEAPAIREVITLAPGTAIDARGAVLCHATVAQLIARGAEAACPAASRVGEGTAAGIAHGARVQYHLGVYAFPGKLSFAAEQNGVSLRQGFFGTVSGGRITLDTPTLNGAIDPTLFTATIAAHSHSGHAFILTPQHCPATGKWTTKSTFQALSAASGGHPIGQRQTVTAQTACRSK